MYVQSSPWEFDILLFTLVFVLVPSAKCQAAKKDKGIPILAGCHSFPRIRIFILYDTMWTANTSNGEVLYSICLQSL